MTAPHLDVTWVAIGTDKGMFWRGPRHTVLR